MSKLRYFMLIFIDLPSGKTGPGAKNPSLGSSDDEFCLIRNPKAIASSAACFRFKATLKL